MYNILSIDGGGIRGIIPAIILNYIEEQLQKRTGNPDARIADFFDLVAGTSTGGILACYYVKPLNDGRSLAKDVIDVYARRGKEIFKRKFGVIGLTTEIYPAAGLERILKEFFGDSTLADARKDCLVTAYDITERKAVLFTRPDAQRYPHRNYYLREVARATSAAPTYFEPAVVRSLGGVVSYLVDGGMYANNPTLCAFAEATKSINNSIDNFSHGLRKGQLTTFLTASVMDNEKSIKNGAKHPPLSTVNCQLSTELSILSLGTGKERRKYDYNKAKDWGLVGWARPVVDLLLSSSAEVVDYQMRQLFGANPSLEGRAGEGLYTRLEPALAKAKPDMDDASPANIQKLTDAAHAFIEENIERLDEVIKRIKRTNE